MNDEIKVAVYCPRCRKRVIDKIGKADVDICIKCPHCKSEIKLNLNFRINKPSNLRYRLAV